MPTPKKESEEAKAVELLKKYSAANTAAQVGVHPSTVQRWAKKHGIELSYPYNRHKSREDLVDVAKILRLHTQKKDSKKPMFTLQEIADMCDCSRSYVKQVVAKSRKDAPC